MMNYLPSTDWESMASWKPPPAQNYPICSSLVYQLHTQEEGLVHMIKCLDISSITPHVQTSAFLINMQPSVPFEDDHKFSRGFCTDQQDIPKEGSIMCRICEDYVPVLYVEAHSKVCAIADSCDQKGLTVDERLLRISETLEKMIFLYSHKDLPNVIECQDAAKHYNSSFTEESDISSPMLSDLSQLDSLLEAENNIIIDDLKDLPQLTCKACFGPKCDLGMIISSAESITPRSPLITPSANHIDMLLTRKSALSEGNDLPQLIQLAEIARCISNTPVDEERSLNYLVAYLEDLQDVMNCRKHEALTVQTFGTRIEKLHREKYLQLCDSVTLLDVEKVEVTSMALNEEDDVAHRLQSSPIHPTIKDRTSIDDFKFIKPISRGAYDRVFLAKKRTTGDVFAIKLTDFGLSTVGLINSTADLSGPAVSGTALYGEEDVQVSAQLNEQEHKKKRSAVGTPDYLAPEILLGTGHGASADWWSLGVILFELIVGLPPFHAHHPQKIFDNILKRKISWPPVPSEMSFEAHDLIDKLLTEDPHQRLGANGATEVKKHMFFKDINWDTLARQKAAFVPSSDDAFDTSYFTSRYSWNPSDEQIYEASELEDSSDNGSVSGNNSCMSHHDALGDDTGGPDEFDHSTSINYSFSNFSFKNLSQLASINYDLISKGWKEDLLTKSDDS